MNSTARALIWSEFVERTRDRWVLVISLTFTVLASGVSLYARGAEANAAYLSGPSLVTLTSLFVPLVALVLGHDAIVGERERNTLGLLLSLPVSRVEVVLAKYIGRLVALSVSVSLGLGVAVLIAEASQRQVLIELIGPTLVLGAAFLSLGMLISSFSERQATATSLVVASWFSLVFFYDLGLLALLVGTDGAVEQEVIVQLVQANPVGLYRIQMMQIFAGVEVFSDLGIAQASLRGSTLWLRWLGVCAGPLLLSALLLQLRKVER